MLTPSKRTTEACTHAVVRTGLLECGIVRGHSLHILIKLLTRFTYQFYSSGLLRGHYVGCFASVGAGAMY